MQSPLSYDAAQALRPIREFMESRATYQDVEGLSMISEVDTLKKYVQEFLRHYVKTVPSSGSETRSVAVHFTKPAVIPVETGSTVDLIPVHEIGGEPTIAGRRLKEGHYTRLTSNTEIYPEFYAILLLSKN